MRLLLDPHAFLWLHTERRRLPGALAALLIDPAHDLHLPASGVRALAITLEHALRAADLPAHHRDPFDRLLVAQARTDGLTLVTGDPQLSAYDVPILWD